ncbi:MAG TPA: nucleotidyltransferase domain-containing protein [Anaerolineales bacterium]
MDTRPIARRLTEFRKALAKQIQMAELIVFGSYLEGNATEDSDIDVIIVSDDFTGMTEDERLDILEDAAGLDEPIIHAWGFTPREMEQAGELTTLGYARTAGLRVA